MGKNKREVSTPPGQIPKLDEAEHDRTAAVRTTLQNSQTAVAHKSICDGTASDNAVGTLSGDKDQLKQTLDSMLEGCQIIGRDWHYLYVNDAAIKHSRKTKKELLGRTMMEAYPGIEKTAMFAHLRRCMRGRMPILTENEFAFPDGTKRWFELSIQPHPRGILIISQEITERKKAGEALKESEEKYRVLVENATDQIFMLDKNYKFLSINKTTADFSRKSTDEMIGKSIFEIFPKETAVPFSKNISEVFKTGKSKFIEEKMRIGEKEFYNSTSLNPVKDVKGDVTAIIGIVRDITEHKKAEASLREGEEKMSAILEGYPDSVILIDPKGTIRYANKKIQDMSGLRKEEMIGKHAISLVTRFISIGDVPMLTARLFDAIRGKSKGAVEFYINTKKGRILTETISFRVKVRGEMFVVVVMKDITERKGVEELLRKSEEKYRGLFERSNDAIFIADPRTRMLTDCNKRAEELMGYSKKEMLSMRADSLHPREIVKATMERFREQAKGIKKSIESEILTKDGRRIPVSINSAVIEINGRPKLMGVFRDIAERKRGEERLLNLNRMLRAIREVNQLITKTKDADALLRGACGRIASMEEYDFAWIGLADKRGRFTKAYGKGSNGKMDKALGSLLGGKGPRCVKNALKKDFVLVKGVTAACSSCPLVETCRNRSIIAVSLKSRDHKYGVLLVNLPFEIANDEEELSLLRELSGDLAYALHSIEAEDRREKSEEELFASEEKYRSLFEKTDDMIVMFDPDMAIASFNPSFGRATGWPKKDTIGENCVAIIHPDDISATTKLFKIALGGNVSPLSKTRVRTRYGKYLTIESRFVPFVKDGRVMTVMGIGNDVTERIGSELALKESEERYKNLVENAPDVVYTVTGDGVIVSLNPAFEKITDWKREDWIGKNIVGMVHPLDLPAMISIRRSLNKGRQVLARELRFRMKSGSYRVGEVSAAPLASEGKVVGSFGIIRDVTEKRELRDMIENQALKLESEVNARTAQLVEEKRKVDALSVMKDEFIRNVTHELKTPLSVMAGNLSLLKDYAPIGKEKVWYRIFEMLERNTLRLNRSIDQIMQLGGISAIELKKERVFLLDIVKDVYREHLPLASMRGLVLKSESEPVIVIGDGELLRLAINNLVSNAIKFTEHGSVELALKALDGHVSIKVTDTGIGISAKDRKHLFERFFKADPSAPGTGIGLAITKEIIGKHKGRMTVKSEPGKGSTFEIIIPRVMK